MNISKLTTIIIGLLVFVSLNIQASAIGDNVETRSTLHGIKKIYVEIDKQGIDNRVTPSLVMEDVATKLRLSDVRINDEKISADAVIHISVNGIKAGDDTYLYYASVEIRQLMQTTRRPGVQNYAATWGTSSIGKVSDPDMPQVVRNDIKELINIFLSAHALANQGE